MQPMPTFTSKGCMLHFSISSIEHQAYTIYSTDKFKFNLYNFSRKFFKIKKCPITLRRKSGYWLHCCDLFFEIVLIFFT
jgi:hypothetical protein